MGGAQWRDDCAPASLFSRDQNHTRVQTERGAHRAGASMVEMPGVEPGSDELG